MGIGPRSTCPTQAQDCMFRCRRRAPCEQPCSPVYSQASHLLGATRSCRSPTACAGTPGGCLPSRAASHQAVGGPEGRVRQRGGLPGGGQPGHPGGSHSQDVPHRPRLHPGVPLLQGQHRSRRPLDPTLLQLPPHEAKMYPTALATTLVSCFLTISTGQPSHTAKMYPTALASTLVSRFLKVSTCTCTSAVGAWPVFGAVRSAIPTAACSLQILCVEDVAHRPLLPLASRISQLSSCTASWGV